MNVAVIDIGSPKQGNIGWAIVGPLARTGRDLDTGIEAFAEAVDAGPLALGFEAPMFVPMRDRANDLTRARAGERNQAFSASIGATALVTSTVVVPYVLDRLRRTVPDVVATLNWQGWPRGEAGGPRLLLFEAFVSNRRGARNTNTRHVDDALAAAQALQGKFANGEAIASSVSVERSFNLLGAMMMRTGWTHDLSVLSQPCLVIRPMNGSGTRAGPER